MISKAEQGCSRRDIIRLLSEKGTTVIITIPIAFSVINCCYHQLSTGKKRMGLDGMNFPYQSLSCFWLCGGLKLEESL
jgi:hypothetical protein